jgi:branched-chain amino acid transport system ATP-binding protein
MTPPVELEPAPGPGAASAGGALLTVSGLSKRFGGVVALDGVSLDVAQGECLGVIGPNGAGKSTLLSLISGAQRPTSGSVVFKGQRIDRLRTYAVARLGIGRAHQIPRPFRRVSVRQNLMVAAHSAELGLTRRGEHTEDVLAICGLQEKSERLAGGLTLLDLKRLEVARALALRPELLLLDEVAAGLVGEEIDEIVGLIRGVHERGTTIVLVEHVQSLVRALAGRVIVLDWGRKLAEGTPDEIAAEPDVIRVYLGTSGEEAVPAPAPTPVPGATQPPTILRTEGLSVQYGRLPALHAVDFDLGEAQIVAVLGANGAGKTSLAQAIAGLTPAAAGRVWFDGEDITSRPAHERARLGISLCFEGRRLFTSLTVRENLELAATYASRSGASTSERIRQVFELFPVLEQRAKSGAGELSGGQQQMLAIGRSLVTDPRVIVLDELSLGLAPQVIDEVYRAVRRLREWGVSVLLIEQNVHRSLAVADRVYVLERGHVRFTGSPVDLGSEEAVVKAYFGGARSGSDQRSPGGGAPDPEQKEEG